MSAAAMKWARQQTLSQTQKAVLVALASHHSPRSGYSKPSQQQIAYEIGVSRETVNRATKALEASQHIKSTRTPRKKGQWEQCFYVLNMPPVSAKNRGRRVTEDHTAPCDFDQTRHRVTEDHTSIDDNRRSPSQVLNFPVSLSSAGGRS
jgi:DNA-binding transcriptional MocR family regulator